MFSFLPSLKVSRSVSEKVSKSDGLETSSAIFVTPAPVALLRYDFSSALLLNLSRNLLSLPVSDDAASRVGPEPMSNAVRSGRRFLMRATGAVGKSVQESAQGTSQ